MPTAYLALLYRERFHLSAVQMEEEPVEAVFYWQMVEIERQKRRQQPDG